MLSNHEVRFSIGNSNPRFNPGIKRQEVIQDTVTENHATRGDVRFQD
jgi:hypothetical protein